MKILTDLLLDKTSVSDVIDAKQTNRGATFLSLYSKTINSHLATVAKDVVPLVVAKAREEVTFAGGILVGIADHVMKDRVLRKKLVE